MLSSNALRLAVAAAAFLSASNLSLLNSLALVSRVFISVSAVTIASEACKNSTSIFRISSCNSFRLRNLLVPSSSFSKATLLTSFFSLATSRSDSACINLFFASKITIACSACSVLVASVSITLPKALFSAFIAKALSSSEAVLYFIVSKYVCICRVSSLCACLIWSVRFAFSSCSLFVRPIASAIASQLATNSPNPIIKRPIPVEAIAPLSPLKDLDNLCTCLPVDLNDLSDLDNPLGKTEEKRSATPPQSFLVPFVAPRLLSRNPSTALPVSSIAGIACALSTTIFSLVSFAIIPN